MTNDNRPLSANERAELLELYDGLRVTDVTDGLDANGFHEINQLSKDIRPLLRDPEQFSHRFVGFANTIRFHPTNERRDLPPVDELDFDSFTDWRDQWYGERSGDPADIQDGDVIVVEAHGIDVGIIGSMNALTWTESGAVGVVTNGGPRDTDELILQNIPVYSKEINKPIIPGRTEVDAKRVPVNVGGCLIRPDDIIVADGDGVVVVPFEHAESVGKDAREEQQADQEMRREYYDKLGMEHDFTLE